LETQRYTQLAKAKTESLKAAYVAFIESHSAEDIQKANVARRWLHKNEIPGYGDLLVDHRCPKRPLTSFVNFYQAKLNSLGGDSIQEKAREAGRQWSSMTDVEKKVRAIRIVWLSGS